MIKLTCIDVLHAQGVNNYILSHGHNSVLCGRGVITTCDDEMVLDTAAGYGLALQEQALPEEVDEFNKLYL